jgi:hypothetical protein
VKELSTKSSLSQFRARVARSVRRANPDATDLTITWKWSRRVTFPTGLKGFSGLIELSAPGYATRPMIATWADTIGLSVGGHVVGA